MSPQIMSWRGHGQRVERFSYRASHPSLLVSLLFFPGSWSSVGGGLSHNPQLWQMLTLFYLPPGSAKTVTFTLVSFYLCFLSPLWIRVATKWNLLQQGSIGKQLPLFLCKVLKYFSSIGKV